LESNIAYDGGAERLGACCLARRLLDQVTAVRDQIFFARTELDRISAAALESAVLLPAGSDPSVVANHLYFHGRAPVTTWHEMRWSTDALAHALALDSIQQSVVGTYARHGSLTPDAVDGRWITWSRGWDLSLPTPKVYVSPTVDSIRAAVEVALDYVTSRDVVAMKVPSDAAGLLRPDKLIFYFEHSAAARGFANCVSDPLSKLSAHGVPFSQQVGPSSIVSIGVDPPASDFEPAHSWRTWMTSVLARGISEWRRVVLPSLKRGHDPCITAATWGRLYAWCVGTGVTWLPGNWYEDVFS
jgi:hypothetical protein